MASVEQLTVQFSGKGAPKLTGQINALAAAMNRLAAIQGKHAKATTQVTAAQQKVNNEYVRNFRNQNKALGITTRFGQTMSGLRSKLLIWAFAVGMVTQAFMRFVNAGKEYLQLTGRMDSILKSTGGTASRTSEQLIDMADSMQESLAIANTAIMQMQTRLLTFTNIVGETFDKTVALSADLSAVFGQDLNQSAVQLGKALNDPIQGMSALRRIGISFSQEQKNSIRLFINQGRIIEAQGVIVKELEREFGNAAKAQAEFAEGATEIEKAKLAWSDFFRELSTDRDGFFAHLGKRFQTFAKLAQGEDISEAFGFDDDTKVLDYADAVGTLGFAVIPYLIARLRKTKSELDDTFDGETLVDFSAEFELFEGVLSRAESQTIGYTKALMDYTQETYKSFTNTELLSDQLVRAKEGFDAGTITYEEFLNEIEHVNEALVNNAFAIEAAGKVMAANLTTYDQYGAVLDGLFSSFDTMPSHFDKFIEKSQDMFEFYGDGVTEMVEFQQLEQQFIQESMALIGETIAAGYEQAYQDKLDYIRKAGQADIDELKQSWKYQKASVKNQKKMEEEKKKITNKRLKEEFETYQKIQKAGVIIDGARAMTKAIETSVKTFGMPYTAFIAVQTALQLATINAQKAPTMRYGGLIGGEPHSRGGTNINAERGEFVMRREAVEAVGIETMNRINKGGGAGSVQISFQGNVLSKDFIEDEAIPQIKEAIRRGADIGIG